MIFDTDVIIWALRGNQRANLVLTACAERSVSIISWMELVQGARDRRELQLIRKFMAGAQFRIIPVAEITSHRAATLVEQHSLRDGLELADALIAATALEANLPLTTGNDRHFRPIAGLSVKPFRASGAGTP